MNLLKAEESGVHVAGRYIIYGTYFGEVGELRAVADGVLMQKENGRVDRIERWLTRDSFAMNVGALPIILGYRLGAAG